MAFDWTKANLVPRGDLLAWHQYEQGVSAGNYAADYSGAGRHLSAAAGNAPVLQANLQNGQSGWYFNGSRDPLVFTGSLTPRHVFIVASAAPASFSDYNGLLTGPTLGDILVANGSGDLFFNTSGSYSSTYRKSDVVYAPTNLRAPMSGLHAVLEVQIPSGLAMDGIQIGKQRNLTGRLWNGYWFETLIYGAVKSPTERYFLYSYFAMRYRLWPQNSAGYNVFPFAAEKSRNVSRDLESYLSEPYSGDPVALTRGTMKRAFELSYNVRLEQEFAAAEDFHAQHYPLTKFVLRDYRFNDPRESVCRLTTPLREAGSGVTNRFNYAFGAVETG